MPLIYNNIQSKKLSFDSQIKSQFFFFSLLIFTTYLYIRAYYLCFHFVSTFDLKLDWKKFDLK
jgi:hypothetical protein